ncbi:MAG: ABC transporter substrate-binding protein [Rhodomicrobium sp.]|nr:ABC transporter substrate-binding protein [Rhodomicrobium sp.]
MRRFFSREFLAVFIPALLIGAAAFWFALRYVQPAPPKSFVISAASKGSPYYELALRYKEEIAKKGVTLEVRESGGSFDNLKALKDPNSGVQAGIIQGGLANSLDAPDLSSMGRLLTEPVWIFYHAPDKLDHITQLKGKRILIGPDGSGTSSLARKLLEANGITAENSTLITMQLPAYVDAFANGSADAGFLVLGAEAKTVQRLLRQPGTNLLNMAQADALIQRYPYLSSVMLRRGVVDFAQNTPPADTSLVATRAMLLVRDDLHPALVTVLAQAVYAVQSAPTLTSTGESRLFALSADALAGDPEFPMADDARRVYKSGPTFFQRVLPFWLATLLDRAFILILPVIGIILPLIRLVPVMYNWRMRQRILYWYKELKNLENDLPKTAAPDLIEMKERELERIEEGVRKISVPIQFVADLYNLRDHVEFVKRNIAQLRGGQTKPRAQPAFTG